MIASGGAWTPEWTIEQPAATLWYHPHPHGSTEQQVRQGLAGMVLVRDEMEQALGLPREYGVDDVVETGRTEAWTVVNEVGVPHNFHVHAARLEISSIDGEHPPPELAGWKDTVYLRPDAEYRLLMRFDQADPDQPYMYHCHLLWHEDRGMTGQFVVVRPGQEPGEPPPVHGGAPSESVTSFGIGSSHDHR